MAVLAHDGEAEAEHRLAPPLAVTPPMRMAAPVRDVGHVADADRHALAGPSRRSG